MAVLQKTCKILSSTKPYTEPIVISLNPTHFLFRVGISVGNRLQFSAGLVAILHIAPGITFSTQNKVKMSTISKTMIVTTSMMRFF